MPKKNNLPGDAVTALSNAPELRRWPTDAEIWMQIKIRARQEIDAGMWPTHEAVDERTRTYATWLESMNGVLRDETILQWMHYEVMFAASAHKYLRELEAAKESCK